MPTSVLRRADSASRLQFRLRQLKRSYLKRQDGKRYMSLIHTSLDGISILTIISSSYQISTLFVAQSRTGQNCVRCTGDGVITLGKSVKDMIREDEAEFASGKVFCWD